jgi:two-component system, OmpR family, heavy metal sensor histidine kinase CusS
MIRSLQLRLLLTTSLASSVILAMLSLSIYYAMQRRLVAEFDAGLKAKARTIAAMVEWNDGKITFDADLAQMPEFTNSHHPEFFEIWLKDGSVLARSATLQGKNLPRSAAVPDPTGLPALLPDGHRGRQTTLAFDIRVDQDEVKSGMKNQTATVVLAARPILVTQTLEDLGWLLSILCGVAVVLSGAALIFITRRAMIPVNTVAEKIGALSDLSRRLNVYSVPLELEPVVEKLNGLLGRLEESFAREKAFTADVAHELRTPLAGLVTTLEVCRSRRREPEAYESALDDCRAMTLRLQAMIETLLMLARADAGQLPMKKQLVDLNLLTQECWQAVAGRAAQRNISVQNSVQGDCTLQIDSDKIRMVISNLLDNAVSHANDGGSIRWLLAKENDSIKIEIANTGSAVPEADAFKLFDRFYRGDQARADTGVHCGLGLSLCKRLLGLMGGRVAIETHTGGEFLVKVRF